MELKDSNWSELEKKVAKSALDKSRKRESAALIEMVRNRAKEITKLDDLWYLHDFLSARRYDLDGKYDEEGLGFIFVLAGLVKDSWLDSADLEGLETDKLKKIKALTLM